MRHSPQITDRPALERYRRRAAAADPVRFLHDIAQEELQDRLLMVKKTFNSIAIVTGFPQLWADFLPDATIIKDDETLALDPGRFDLVLHVLALHWANDPVGQLIQCRQALKPDGLFLGVLFGGQTLNELRVSLAEAESRVAGGLSPRVAPMGEIRDLGALLQRAGLALPVADSQSQKVSYRSPFHLMRDLRMMGEGNALAARLRRPTGQKVLKEAARIYAESFTTAQDRITATFEMIYLTGWAPAESQPKPLRPGSAKTRLAEALGVSETPLKD